MNGWAPGLYVYHAKECTCLDDDDAIYVGETGRGLARHTDDDRLNKLFTRLVRTVLVRHMPGSTKEDREAAEQEFMDEHPTPANIRGNPDGFDGTALEAIEAEQIAFAERDAHDWRRILAYRWLRPLARFQRTLMANLALTTPASLYLSIFHP